jgi:hypothetical protein
MPTYDRTKAVDYARKWAKSTNPTYPRFDNDCTSFVSQALLEGGWTMIGGDVRDRTEDKVWWYGKSMFTSASYTWGGAQNLANFLRVSKRGKQVTDSMTLQLGDVLQLAKTTGHIYHTMMVTKKTPVDIFLSYHTSDHLDEPLSAIRSRLPAGEKLVPWQIADTFT